MSAVWTSARLALRLQAFEVRTVLAGAVVLIGALAFVGFQMTSTENVDPSCFRGQVTVAPGCDALTEAWGAWFRIGDGLANMVRLSPFVAGVLLGSPIVAREIEHRTSLLAWSLRPSRTQWLAIRSWPIGLLLLLAVTAVASSMELYLQSSTPGRSSLVTDFYWYDARGLLVPSRAVLAFAIGLAAGAALGRVLPAIIAAAVVVAAVTVISGFAIGAWRATDAVPYAVGPSAPLIGAIEVGSRVRTGDGRLLTFEEAAAERIVPLVEGQIGPELPEGYEYGEEVVLIVPGSRAQAWTIRESIATLVLAAGGFASAAVICRRRRPL